MFNLLQIVLMFSLETYSKAYELPRTSLVDTNKISCRDALTTHYNGDKSSTTIANNGKYHTAQNGKSNRIQDIINRFHRVRDPFNRYKNGNKKFFIELIKKYDGDVSKVAVLFRIPKYILYRMAVEHERKYNVQIRDIKENRIRGSYLDEEKDLAVELVIEFGTISQAATVLGIPEPTVRSWVIDHERRHDVQIRNGYIRHSDEYKMFVIGVVIESDGNVARAADTLGLTTTTVWRWVVAYEEEHGTQIRSTITKKYSEEEKMFAIELVKKFDGNVRKVALKLNIPVSTLRGWVVAYERKNKVQIRQILGKRYSN